MTAKRQSAYAVTRHGRIIRRLAALCRDHRIRWHWSGIVRELGMI